MQQHPVPQNITSFEFKLVGFLTLKQFGYLAGAAIISFTLYFAVPGIIRWLLIALVSLLGITFAFIPINSMTFDKWLTALIRAIILPSRRVWRKDPKEISFLAPTFAYYLRRAPSAGAPIVPGRSKLESFLTQLGTGSRVDKFDALERTRLTALPFREGPVVPTTNQPEETPSSTVVITDETVNRPLHQEGREINQTKEVVPSGH